MYFLFVGTLHRKCLIKIFAVDEFTGLPDMMSDGFLKCPVNMIVSNVLSGI